MVSDFDFSKRLYQEYFLYRESAVTRRRFNYSHISPLINRLKDNDNFIVNKAGESSQGRPINLISYGSGEIPVFLWSQMHGNESTATMAMFDIFNFLSADDSFNQCRKKLGRKLTIYFMPMVNPDGAELFTRETPANIDINRDAAKLQTVEARILLDAFNTVKAKFGFNLHDQDRIYSAGSSHMTAAISFLAPPLNVNRDINKTRGYAMKLIAGMNDILQKFIPAHVAKYTDEFEPRAFGDLFQKLGTSTILIESGWWHEDNEKQFIRKLNFITLLTAFKNIAEGEYKKNDIDAYEKIPFNEKNMMDLILRNVKYTSNGKEYVVDIGINREEKPLNGSAQLYYESKFEQIGDLSVFHGYEDYNFKNYYVRPGKIYPNEFQTLEELKKIDFISLYRQGFLSVKLSTQEYSNELFSLPVNVLRNSSTTINHELKTGKHANFFLEKDNRIKYAVINGFLYNLVSNTGEINNGIVY